jgi:hypothetical protein
MRRPRSNGMEYRFRSLEDYVPWLGMWPGSGRSRQGATGIWSGPGPAIRLSTGPPPPPAASPVSQPQLTNLEPDARSPSIRNCKLSEPILHLVFHRAIGDSKVTRLDRLDGQFRILRVQRVKV